MATKIQFFGHSFIKRLKLFIQDSDDLNFNMNFREPKLIQYSGFPGAQVETLRQNLTVVKDFDPDIIVLVVGTNDIYQPNKSPNSVAQAILDLTDTLLYVIGVKRVVVFQVFHRIRPSRRTRYPVDLDWFNDRVDETNLILTRNIPNISEGRARFWRCNGFWSPEAKQISFSEDGVHLSDHGLRKFYANIRAALVASFNSS